ncbi:zinc finger C2HC domain-containing protein 1C isoform X2 [Aethina tumida]|uniref:zinc finger C2HC domain-containing protein 1C isoform X2 n=1 Tax=Aethina tumida TaxID=116153 RepID=UPI002149566C|nr:zinc finger C2HC domain-containing protein 1C isoform X2 [Aethina tumida]
MNKYLSASLNNVVSLDFETSWAAKSLQDALHLRRFDARFQQKQMQEKEEKLLRLYENQQQRAFERVGRGSAGSNVSVGSTGGGKVRQMFDERRQKAGVDKSYPLEPLRTSRTNGTKGGSLDRQRNTTTKTTVKSTVQKSVTHIKNGKPPVTKREVVQRIYNNNNGDERYQEHRFEDDNYRSPSYDLIEMMNRNNIDDDLDNEILPQIGFDDDEPYMRGKLANVGGKLPSQTVTKPEPRAPSKPNGVATVTRDSKPPARNVARTATPRAVTSSSSSASSVHSSPVKSTTTRTANSTMKATPSSSKTKVPTTARPSAKQAAKSTPTTTPRDDLAECKVCHRKFAEDRLAIHESICLKSSQSKRKKYDATKHRLQGTELEQYGRKATKPKPMKPASKKDWRRTHEEFIAAIRSAKMTQQHLAKGGKLSDLPPPPPSSNPDYVQCPHCGRKFNEAAAERHIPKCATFQFNKPKPNGGSNTNTRGRAVPRR